MFGKNRRVVVSLVGAGESVRLADCPPGFFMCDGEVCFKCEYDSNRRGGDAYTSVGDYFGWALPNREDIMVLPLKVE